MREMFEKAGRMVRPPFERITIGFDGKQLEGYFRKPGGAAGRKFPAVIAFQGADTVAENTIRGAAGADVGRGLAYVAGDFPGPGSALRPAGLPLPPGHGRGRKPVLDQLGVT